MTDINDPMVPLTKWSKDDRLGVWGQCSVCGLWTWLWNKGDEGLLTALMRCGICAQRGLRPGDVTLPPPAVQQAAVCAWDEEA